VAGWGKAHEDIDQFIRTATSTNSDGLYAPDEVAEVVVLQFMQSEPIKRLNVGGYDLAALDGQKTREAR